MEFLLVQGGVQALVAWSPIHLTITDLDPLPFNLLFERFLNPNVSRCPILISIFVRIVAMK